MQRVTPAVAYLECHVCCCHVEQYSSLVLLYLCLVVWGLTHNKVHNCQGPLVVLQCSSIVLLLVGTVAGPALL